MDLQTKRYKITWIIKLFPFIMENTSFVTFLLEYLAIVFIKFELQRLLIYCLAVMFNVWKIYNL
jgi:hypothetical protein